MRLQTVFKYLYLNIQLNENKTYTDTITSESSFNYYTDKNFINFFTAICIRIAEKIHISSKCHFVSTGVRRHF